MDQKSNGFRRPHSTPGERAQWAARFQRSGLSQKAFAQRHDLNVFTLRKWLEGQPPSPRRTARLRRKILVAPLREISLGQMLGSSWVAEVSLSSGTTIRLGAQAAPELAQTLLRALPC